jgi:hypothetical protein
MANSVSNDSRAGPPKLSKVSRLPATPETRSTRFLRRLGKSSAVSPDSRATACPPSGRNSTYRPVQISGTGSVPLGNVYYYFKTKDEIGEAIVELRLAELSAQRQRWTEAGSPKDRLCACVQGVFENKDFLAQRGCAVGTFCSELHKAGGSVAARATEIFAQRLAWIESQFRALGKGKDSRAGFKACETPGGLNPQAHTAKPKSRHVAAGPSN